MPNRLKREALRRGFGWRPARLTGVAMVALLAACSPGGGASEGAASPGLLSRLNPLNWFDAGQEAAVAQSAEAQSLRDGRALVDEILEVYAERTDSGAILNVRGRAERQGAYDVALVALNDGLPDAAGLITYELRAKMRAEGAGAQRGSARSQEILAGAHLSVLSLSEIRGVRVMGAKNSITIRR